MVDDSVDRKSDERLIILITAILMLLVTAILAYYYYSSQEKEEEQMDSGGGLDEVIPYSQEYEIPGFKYTGGIRYLSPKNYEFGVDLEFTYVGDKSDYRLSKTSTNKNFLLWNGVYDVSENVTRGVKKTVINVPSQGEVYMLFWKHNDTYLIASTLNENPEFYDFMRLLLDKYPST